MIDYYNLKKNYIAAVQMGLNMGLADPEHGNDLLHKFCENLIDNSHYSEQDKRYMKHDLELVKEALAKEIEQIDSTCV